MNEEMARVVAALRSGKYQQTRSVLHRVGVGYCCMGVAADVLDPLGWGETSCSGAVSHCLGSNTALGDVGLAKLGIDKFAQATLVDMNDYGRSFGEIAAFIEMLP